MQQGAGAKPEWQGKRLVAIKRMKKRWEGGWDECRRHPELEVSPLHHFLGHHRNAPVDDFVPLYFTRGVFFLNK